MPPGDQDAKALQKRTLTKLCNQRPAWLVMAHEALDKAVAAAYGWSGCTPQMNDGQAGEAQSRGWQVARIFNAIRSGCPPPPA